MQIVLQKMQVSMELKGFAESTTKTYLAHVKRFAAFCDKPLHDRYFTLAENMEVTKSGLHLCCQALRN